MQTRMFHAQLKRTSFPQRTPTLSVSMKEECVSIIIIRYMFQDRNTSNDFCNSTDNNGVVVDLSNGASVMLFGMDEYREPENADSPSEFPDANFSDDEVIERALAQPVVDEVGLDCPESLMESPLDVHLYDNEELTRYVQDFIRRCNKHRMNKGQRSEMWSLARDWKLFEPSEMQSYDSLDRKLKAALPTPTVYWKVKCHKTGQIISGKGRKFPEKRFKNKSQYETLCIWTRVRLRDLIRFHAGQHPSAPYIEDGKVRFNKVHLTFTYDGLANGKSSPDNLNVMGVQFKGCRQVYIPCVRVARRREKKNLSKFLDHFVQECCQLGVHVDYFLADAPMRAFLKSIKGHAGRFSCEYCEAEGECHNRKIVYPMSSLKQQKRTHARWLEHVADLESQREHGAVGSVKGVTGRSPLLKIRHFDIVKKAPSDPFHRDWLGICKSTLWRHTVGLSKGTNLTAQGKRITEKISNIYKKINLPSEFSHRSREIDYANFKGHEWKSMSVSCFPSICKLVEEEAGHATAHVWLLFIFLALINYGPQWARDEIKDAYLIVLHELMYEQFQDAFGESACTYNWHAFSHMPDISKHGKPSEISTEPFESAYAQVQASYKSGTRNIGIQIVSNMLIKRLNHTEGFACRRHLKIEPRATEVRFDDSIVLDEHYNYYRVVHVEGELFAANPIRTKPWTCAIDPNLPMRFVGVCLFAEASEVEVVLRREDIRGKAVITPDNIIIPFYQEMLFS